MRMRLKTSVGTKRVLLLLAMEDHGKSWAGSVSASGLHRTILYAPSQMRLVLI